MLRSGAAGEALVERYLSAKDIAERLGVHVRKARRFMRQMTRLVPTPGGVVRVSERNFARWLEARTVGPEPLPFRPTQPVKLRAEPKAIEATGECPPIRIVGPRGRKHISDVPASTRPPLRHTAPRRQRPPLGGRQGRLMAATSHRPFQRLAAGRFSVAQRGRRRCPPVAHVFVPAGRPGRDAPDRVGRAARPMERPGRAIGLFQPARRSRTRPAPGRRRRF